jgi:hypothetical protein
MLIYCLYSIAYEQYQGGTLTLIYWDKLGHLRKNQAKRPHFHAKPVPAAVPGRFNSQVLHRHFQQCPSVPTFLIMLIGVTVGTLPSMHLAGSCRAGLDLDRHHGTDACTAGAGINALGKVSPPGRRADQTRVGPVQVSIWSTTTRDSGNPAGAGINALASSRRTVTSSRPNYLQSAVPGRAQPQPRPWPAYRHGPG